MYSPLNYDQINLAAGYTRPSSIKSYNNKTFNYWCRSLYQRACSVINFELPEEWSDEKKDFFYWILFKYGYLCVFNDKKFGLSFQPCQLNGFDFYYQPTDAIVSNPKLQKTFKIHEDCEIIKLCNDYAGIFDTIEYYAEKLSNLDNAINMSIINSKFAFILGARNKGAAEALKKLLDKVNNGEPAVIFDTKLLNDQTDKDSPFQFLERMNTTYLTTEQLQDFNTILNNFDAEIGIPTIPYQKKERMVTSEADSRMIDSTSRSVVWLETLENTIKNVNKMFGCNIQVSLRYELDEEPEENTEEEEEYDYGEF